MKTLLIALSLLLGSCITSNDNSTLEASAYTSSGMDTLSIAGNSFVWRNCPSDYSSHKNIAGTWQNTTDTHARSWPSEEYWTFKVTTPCEFEFTVLLTMYDDAFFMYRDSAEVSIAYIKLK